jgi:hypothetical protein
MGAITVFLAPKMLGGREAGFTGTPEQAMIILLLFGVLIVFGLASVASGVFALATGRRNKWIAYGAMFLGLLVLAIGAGARLLLGA